MAPKPIPIGVRFLRYVDTTADHNVCWLWKGAARGGKGYEYGVLFSHYEGKRRVWRRAHRLSYELFVGPIPDGHGVLHKCDVPRCVNPHHLFTGTQLDNMTDANNKGRIYKGGSFNGPRGATHPTAKLDDEKVREIRALLAQRVPQATIGKRYGVAQFVISRIHRRVGWAHVKD